MESEPSVENKLMMYRDTVHLLHSPRGRCSIASASLPDVFLGCSVPCMPIQILTIPQQLCLTMARPAINGFGHAPAPQTSPHDPFSRR